MSISKSFARKLTRHKSNPDVFVARRLSNGSKCAPADEAKKLEQRLYALSEKGAIDPSDYSKILRMIRTGRKGADLGRVFRMCALLLSSIESARGIQMYAKESNEALLESPVQHKKSMNCKVKRDIGISLGSAPKVIFEDVGPRGSTIGVNDPIKYANMAFWAKRLTTETSTKGVEMREAFLLTCHSSCHR